jgi:transposase
VPNRHTVRTLIEKFHETGSVSDIKRSGRPSVLTEDKLLMMQSAESFEISSEVGTATSHRCCYGIYSDKEET